MPKTSIHPQSRKHILILDEDWEYLSEVYGPGSTRPIGAGPAIKSVVHQFVKQLKAKTAQELDSHQPAGEGKLQGRVAPLGADEMGV